MKKIYYHTGSDNPEKENAEYFALLDELKTRGRCVGSEWRGDYYVDTYELDGETWEHWFDWEYGIESELEQIA